MKRYEEITRLSCVDVVVMDGAYTFGLTGSYTQHLRI